MSAAHLPAEPARELARDRAARIARDLLAQPPGDSHQEDLLAKAEEALREPKLLGLVWPHVVATIRRDWRLDRKRLSTALARTWAEFRDALQPQEIRGIAHVAYACFDVRMAQRALAHLSSREQLLTSDVLLEAMCHAALGNPQAALALCDNVVAREPYNLSATRLRGQWRKRIESWSPPWRAPVTGEGGLLLEPLDPEHAPALAWQYRDPAIAEKTVLPPIDHPGQAQKWIEHRLAETPAAYAFIHGEHGLIGSTEIAISGAEAFLCLWIGTDWQRRGFGRSLIDLACRHAFRGGIEVMLTAAFDSNIASLRALRSCGFVELPVRAAEPDHERTFLYRALQPMDHAAVIRRLIGFCDRTETGLVFPGGA